MNNSFISSSDEGDGSIMRTFVPEKKQPAQTFVQKQEP